MRFFKQTFAGIATATLLTITMVSIATPAVAWDRHYRYGGDGWGYAGAAAAGLAGGLLIGTMTSQPRRAYDSYDSYDGYDGAPVCHIERRRVFDDWGNYLGIRRVRVCE